MNKKIMDRIAKLLSKTTENGCTPEEAATASKMAQKLIAKHHIDMRAYEPEEINTGRADITRDWMHTLATAVASNMCCKVVGSTFRRKKYLTFVGRDTDREACIKTWEMMVAVCKRGATIEKRKVKEKYGTDKGVEKVYAMSFAIAVNEEMSKQCRALVLVVPEEVTCKYHALFPNAKQNVSKPIRYATKAQDGINEAGAHGYAAGKEAASRKGIEN